MRVLPVTSRSLAKSVDGVHRDRTFSLVSTLLTRGSLLPDDALISFNAAKYYYGFGSAETKLTYEPAARLYSETARKTTNRKSRTFVVIVSL
jgi:uncharacterized ParB-like nuclease family protein